MASSVLGALSLSQLEPTKSQTVCPVELALYVLLIIQSHKNASPVTTVHLAPMSRRHAKQALMYRPPKQASHPTVSPAVLNSTVPTQALLSLFPALLACSVTRVLSMAHPVLLAPTILQNELACINNVQPVLWGLTVQKEVLSLSNVQAGLSAPRASLLTMIHALAGCTATQARNTERNNVL